MPQNIVKGFLSIKLIYKICYKNRDDILASGLLECKNKTFVMTFTFVITRKYIANFTNFIHDISHALLMTID